VNVASSVHHHAIRHPHRTAVDEDGERQLSYAELRERSNRVAHLLAAHGVRPGDRVAYLMLNRLEVVEILVGCASINAVAAPLNFRLGEGDLRAILTNCLPRVIVTEAEFLDKISGIAADLGARVLCLGSTYDEDLAAASTAAPAGLRFIDGGSDLLIQYTSGTTGRSKGATFTHDAVLMHAANVALEYGFHDRTRTLVCIPHNSATNIQLIPSLYRGSTLVLTDPRSFDGPRWADRVNTLGVTSSQMVPTMLYRVLEAHKKAPTAMDTVECIGYGSAPMPPDRVEELLAVFGPVFLQLYGMIEIAAMGSMLRPAEHEWALKEAPQVLASVGQPSYGMEVRVVADDGTDAAAGERGEIAFKAPYMMTGYFGAPDLTASTVRDGWLYSGDVGEVRDGWLYLVDRKKDLIIRGGQNIASKEVEDALAAHPAVMEAAVVGVPSAEWGEDIVAAVMIRPGFDVTEADLLAACRTFGLARFKAPARVEFVAELPRNAIGKVQKAELRRRYTEHR
jgi:fatty-acyl-CoA synthase